MSKLTDEEIKKAFNIWIQNYHDQHDFCEENPLLRSKDQNTLTPFLNDKIKSFGIDNNNWLKKARLALFLSCETMALKLNISRTAYVKYENGEATGTISLATLAKAAEAMECELVYAIRPKNKKYFSQIIFEKLLPKSLLHPWIKNCDQKRRHAGLAYVLNYYMNDPVFRKTRGWSQQANK